MVSNTAIEEMLCDVYITLNNVENIRRAGKYRDNKILDIVSSISESLGIPTPEVLIHDGVAMYNAYLPNHDVLLISKTAPKLFNRRELCAIIAHEMAHIKQRSLVGSVLQSNTSVEISADEIAAAIVPAADLLNAHLTTIRSQDNRHSGLVKQELLTKVLDGSIMVPEQTLQRLKNLVRIQEEQKRNGGLRFNPSELEPESMVRRVRSMPPSQVHR